MVCGDSYHERVPPSSTARDPIAAVEPCSSPSVVKAACGVCLVGMVVAGQEPRHYARGGVQLPVPAAVAVKVTVALSIMVRTLSRPVMW